MAMLTRIELDQLVEHHSKHDPFQNWRQRDDELHFRSLYVKHDHQLVALDKMYSAKFERIKRAYLEYAEGTAHPPIGSTVDEMVRLYEEKLIRMAIKFRDVEFEVRGRRLDNLKRNPIGTEYFIDLDAGNNGNTGLSPAQAWLTVQQYTTTTVRSPGDIAWVRAATSQQLAATVVHDEDGTGMAPIYMIGCQAGSGSGSDIIDPWGDDDDTRPQIDSNNAANRPFDISGDDFWEFHNFELMNFNGTSGMVSASMARGIRYRNCLIHDQNNAGSAACLISSPDRAEIFFEDCDIYDAVTVVIFMGAGVSKFLRCNIDGPANYGHYFQGGQHHFEECRIGQNAAFTTDDFLFREGDVLFRRCVFNDFEPTQCNYIGGSIRLEDCFEDSTPIADVLFNSGWKTEKETTVVRAGGGPQSAKISPNLYAGGGVIAGSLDIHAGMFPGPMVVWGEAGVEMTITVYIRAITAWATYPTAETLYLEAEYLDDPDTADSTHRAKAYSDEVISDGSTWVGFAVTITPQQNGPVYLNVLLRRYEAGEGIYVDLTPVVS